MNNIITIIPARKASTRLPNKMLSLIGDKPMIIHAAERAQEANIGNVIVATDSDEIFDESEIRGFQTVMTSPNHQSGTDRIFEALEKTDPHKKYDIVINLQGDVPFLNPALIKQLTDKLEHSNADILTLASKISAPEEAQNPNIVNIAIAFYDKEKTFGKALYFSRQPIPYNAKQYYEHIGIYLYRRPALEKFVRLSVSELEGAEKLEQLRALENNMKIDVCIIDESPVNVDTAEDLEKARHFYVQLTR